MIQQISADQSSRSCCSSWQSQAAPKRGLTNDCRFQCIVSFFEYASALFFINLLLLSAHVRLRNGGAANRNCDTLTYVVPWQLVGKVFSQFMSFSSSYKFHTWTFHKGYFEPAVAKENPPEIKPVLSDANTSVLSFLTLTDPHHAPRVSGAKLER